MGKIKRLQNAGAKVPRPGPLAEQIEKSEYAQPSARKKVRKQRSDGDDEVKAIWIFSLPTILSY